MSDKLISLPHFSYTSLDFDSIIEDVKNLIIEHPEYNQNWEDFLESNSGRMFVEIMSWITEKSAARTDWISNELFVSTATQRQSIINLLRLINHRPHLPRAGKVNASVKLTGWAPSFSMPVRETVFAKDTTGNTIKFECIEMATDGKPDYDYKYTFLTGSEAAKTLEFSNIPFYQGSTSIDEVYVEGLDNEEVVLDNYPVIENSVRIFSKTRGFEFLEVDSFISPEAQQNDIPESQRVPVYLVKTDARNRVTIQFGNSSFVLRPLKNEGLDIYYRTGGGVNTNIVTGAMKQTRTYSSQGKRISAIFTNPASGFGGTDEEDLDQAKLSAPLTLRSANKAVTREDYISHLEGDSSIMHANVIGKENEPADIYNEYGHFLPPLDTWIYVTPLRSGIAETNPYNYNGLFSIGKPYVIYNEIDSEEISLSSIQQTVYLTKYKKNFDKNLYITLHDTYATDYLAADSYREGIDYTLDPITCEFTRISTGDGGIIPSSSTLKIRYIDHDLVEFKSMTVKQFDATDEIILGSTPNSLYPQFRMIIKSVDDTKTYVLNSDYTIDYSTNKIKRLSDGDILYQEKVIIYYANNWQTGDFDNSEQKSILSIIKDKKMICVDTYVKDSLYTVFDIKAKIYCYKNMIGNVKNNLETYLRTLYTLNNSQYNTPFRKVDVMSVIMNYSGVRYLEIEYLGTNYDAYRRYLLGDLQLDQLDEMSANKVENEIPCKYNEMLVLSDDEYDGDGTLENKRHGLIFEYRES